MAERLMVLCDICGKAPAETVGINARGKNYRKDVCSEHLAELLKGTRAPKRGRRPGAQVAPPTAKRRGRPPKVAAATV